MYESVLEYIKGEKTYKRAVLIINKCDLVLSWVTARGVSPSLESTPPDTSLDTTSYRDISASAIIPWSERCAQVVHEITKHARHFSPEVSMPG